MRSVNCPLLGWSPSSEHLAFQKYERRLVILGKLLYPQEPRAQVSQGNSRLPSPGPSSATHGCQSRLPRADYSSAPKHSIAPHCPHQGSPNSGPRPDLTCPAFVTRGELARSHTHPSLLFMAAWELKGQNCAIATKPKMFALWLLRGKDDQLAGPSLLLCRRDGTVSVGAMLGEYGEGGEGERRWCWGPQPAATCLLRHAGPQDQHQGLWAPCGRPHRITLA